MKFIKQIDESDCGPACIAMIASHFNAYFSVSTIRRNAFTDKDGTNITGMIKAAESIGLSAKAIKGKAEDIKPTLQVPFIAHIRQVYSTGENRHFIVVKKVTKRHVIVLDPAKGNLRLSYNDFFKGWTGIVLILNPSSGFKEVKENRGNLMRFFPLIKANKKELIKVGISSLLISVFGIVSSFYMRYLIDDVLFSNSFTTLHILSSGVIFLSMFQAFLEAIRSHILLFFSTKIDCTLIFNYFKHITKLPISFFDSRHTGEILSRMDDASNIRLALSESSITVVMDTIMLILVGSMLFYQSSTLFGIAFIVIPLSVLLVIAYKQFFSKSYKKLMEDSADVQTYLFEVTSGMNTVKSLNASEIVYDEFEKRQMKVIETGFIVGTKRILLETFNMLINSWGGNVIFWVGSYFILSNSMSLGQLISFNALFTYFSGPMQRLLNLQPTLQEAFVSAERLSSILDMEPEITEGGKWIKPERFSGNIEVKKLSFRYGTRRMVLDDLSFEIESSEKVAFVGASGCGKTTLVKLLMKFYVPESGGIWHDGHNLKDIDTTHLRSRIGYVPQDIFLFSGTIAENISLQQPEATLEEIISAARRARAHKFIENLPDRYNTVINERGMSLSGGERQRIALARALLGKPDFIIFDEATSNLDSITEREIHETLDMLRGERITTILIAHRLSTVVNCDRIFVMDSGKIIEEGKHSSLLAKDGLYSKLWQGVPNEN